EGFENLPLDVIGEGLVYRATQRQTEDAIADVGIFPPGSWLTVVFQPWKNCLKALLPRVRFKNVLYFTDMRFVGFESACHRCQLDQGDRGVQGNRFGMVLISGT